MYPSRLAVWNYSTVGLRSQMLNVPGFQSLEKHVYGASQAQVSGHRHEFPKCHKHWKEPGTWVSEQNRHSNWDLNQAETCSTVVVPPDADADFEFSRPCYSAQNCQGRLLGPQT